MIEYPHEFVGWDNYSTPPTLDFKFDFEIPSPRNWRIITIRDRLGRIVEAKTPKPQVLKLLTRRKLMSYHSP